MFNKSIREFQYKWKCIYKQCKTKLVAIENTNSKWVELKSTKLVYTVSCTIAYV